MFQTRYQGPDGKQHTAPTTFETKGDALMILLASWCALRFGELTELRRGDVDLSHARVRVTRSVTWIDGEPTIGTPKSNAGIRDVSIPPHLMSAVQHHLRDHVGLGKDALLFSTAKGEQIGRGGAFQKHWERAAGPLGVMICASTT